MGELPLVTLSFQIVARVEARNLAQHIRLATPELNIIAAGGAWHGRMYGSLQVAIPQPTVKLN